MYKRYGVRSVFINEFHKGLKPAVDAKIFHKILLWLYVLIFYKLKINVIFPFYIQKLTFSVIYLVSNFSIDAINRELMSRVEYFIHSWKACI